MRNLFLLPALLIVLAAPFALRLLARSHRSRARQRGEGPADLPRAA